MNKDCKNISFLLVIYVDQNLLCPWSLISQVQQLNSTGILPKPLTVQPKVRSGPKLVTVHIQPLYPPQGIFNTRWILFDGGPSLRQVGQASVAEQQPECQIKVPKPTWHPRTSRTGVPPWLWSDNCRGNRYTTQSNQRRKINQRSTAPSPLDPVFIGPGAVDPLHISRRSTCQPWPLKHAKGDIGDTSASRCFYRVTEVGTYRLERVTLQTLGGDHKCLLPPAGWWRCVLCCNRKTAGQRSDMTESINMQNSPKGFAAVLFKSYLKACQCSAERLQKLWNHQNNTPLRINTGRKQTQTVINIITTTSVTQDPRRERGGWGHEADSRPLGSDSRSPSGLTKDCRNPGYTMTPRCPVGHMLVVVTTLLWRPQASWKIVLIS